MVRGAFGSAFSDDELDDFYSGAWLSTLAAFERKPRELDDDELRRYVMTAVANQASRELRRRGRKPTVPLDGAPETSEATASPDELATRTEEARITREVIGSLPARRRAVLVYRYGWDLEPKEVCDLIDGLSPRAYRKEIERGVAEVAKKMRLVEEGSWCDSREPLLRAVVAGTADEDEQRQARQHLAHCRSCTGFVEKLNGHLHELGGGLVVALGSHEAGLEPGSLLERAVAGVDRAKQAVSSALTRGSDAAEQATSQLVASGGTKGAGVAGAGAMAKLAGIGAVPKIVAACLGTGAAATACVAAGVVPGGGRDRETGKPEAAVVRSEKPDLSDARRHARLAQITATETETPVNSQPVEPAPAQPSTEQPAPEPSAPAPAPEPAPAPAPEPPPVVQEFEPVGTPTGPAPSSTETASSPSGGGGGGGGDFGP
jgi:DNA-directed RNA polymerase specialized sigma24 family protein